MEANRGVCWFVECYVGLRRCMLVCGVLCRLTEVYVGLWSAM